MLLAELLAASERVAAARSRLAKIDTLAQCLRRLDASEISLGVAYRSGDTPQGKIGIGYAALKDALAATPAGAPRLTLAQIDETLTRLAQIKGEGSAAERARLLAELFARATAPEQDFLARLLLGELRQGALEGIMLDAIAKAANLRPERVRTAAMRAGGLPVMAKAALIEGEAGLARFALRGFQPVQPMLAQASEDVADAIERLGRAAFEWKLDDARARGHEGVMAKALEAPYEAGRRGAAWLKIKAAHTLDLAVIAAEWGSGRRKGWLSNLHLAAPDPATGGFVMLGKTFKGMTDKMLAWQTGRLLSLETSREGHVVHVRPELVAEIAFNEIQASPHYPGGFALRFARVKRYRGDKSAKDADTIETVRTLYRGQLHRRAGESSG